MTRKPAQTDETAERPPVTKTHKVAAGIFAVAVGLFAFTTCSGDDPEPAPPAVTQEEPAPAPSPSPAPAPSPSPAPTKTEEPTVKPTETEDAMTDEELDALTQELALQTTWDQASAEDQMNVCFLYGADPNLAVDSFMEGAGEGTFDRDHVDSFFSEVCGE